MNQHIETSTTRPAAPEALAVPTALHRPDRELVIRAVAKRSYAVLGTVSEAGFPHSAGVIYQAVLSEPARAAGAGPEPAPFVLYTSTMLSSRKARNIETNPRVAVTIPIRRLPVGPPSAVQFQGTAQIVELTDPELGRLADAGLLKAVTGHDELELPGGCFLRIRPGKRLNTFGLGMSLRQLIGDPLSAGGTVELAAG
jgi:nitroimidazol reductase NimA-like FMN-containing flavoprotein (pyridoxamine 5'-phosphate oxidase superfamily)